MRCIRGDINTIAVLDRQRIVAVLDLRIAVELQTFEYSGTRIAAVGVSGSIRVTAELKLYLITIKSVKTAQELMWYIGFNSL